MGCLDENTIVEFIQGTLSVSGARAVEEHVDACVSCRQLLAELARSSFALPSGDVSSSMEEAEEDRPTDPDVSRQEGFRGGQVVAGRYRVLRLLGRGAMGRVYEVDDLQLQERVALKLLRAEVKNVPRLLQHLKHEVVLGRRISHPNVCRLHDIGTFASHHFITMSLVQGENLSSILSRGSPPPSWSVQVLLQICAALEAAHEQGVVHRDLKSSNIMVDTKGKVTVMDFGLARDLWGEPSQSGMLIGSPAYWSPEQACGERATERSDIYSFGVVACELFGARRPLIGGKVDLSHIPAPYREAVTKCVQVSPEDRHDSVQALRRALLQGERPADRSRRRVVVALLLLLSGAAGVAAHSLWPRRPARPAEDPRVVKVTPAPSVDSGAPPDSALVVRLAPTIRLREADARSGPRPPRPRREPAHPPAANAPSAKVTPDAAVPAISVVAPSSPETDGMRRAVEQQLQRLEARREQMGVLPEDLPAYTRSLAGARKALAARDTVESKLAAERMRTVLDRTRIDRAFISRKLARITRLKGSRRLQGEAGKKVHETFGKVHSSYFAGDYKTANIHLNRLWQLLRGVR